LLVRLLIGLRNGQKRLYWVLVLDNWLILRKS
jgi:hypothetical protein